jgi:hypothetical protein
MTNSSLKQAWLNLPPDALQQHIESYWLIPQVLPILGFSLTEGEVVQSYKTGLGGEAVDIAVRKSTTDDKFSHDKSDPSLIIEIKNRATNLDSNSNSYKNTVAQLQRSARQCGTIKKKLRGSNVPFIQRYSRKNC